jgi:hypothetical protein
MSKITQEPICFSKANQVLETFLGSSCLDLVGIDDLAVLYFFGFFLF